MISSRTVEGTSTKQALAILGLEQGASGGEIEARFRRLASETHPDHGGSPESFARVVAARDRLKANESGSDLVRTEGGPLAPSQMSTALLAMEKERNADVQRQERSERITKGLVRAEVSRLTRSKRRASFLAWLGGGAGALTLALRATDSTAESYLEFSWIAPVIIMSILVSVTCAIGSFAVSDQISRIEQAIEDTAEAMTDRSIFLDLMYEMIDSAGIADRNAWTSSELVRAVGRWSTLNSSTTRWDQATAGASPLVRSFVRFALLPLRAMNRIGRWGVSGRFDPTPSLADLATVIGAESFVRLLVAKGEETRLLRPEEEIANGRLLVRHELAITPTKE